MKKFARTVLRWDRIGDEERERWRSCYYLMLRAVLFLSGFLRLNLNFLARLSRTDKADGHTYPPIYEQYLHKYRNQKVTLLELGVGGYKKPEGGDSLRMWQAYFRRGRIVGLDIFDKTFLSKGRVKVYQGSQTDRDILERLTREYPSFDVIIDDGSHVNSHQIKSFEMLFPNLKQGGVYIVEDVQTSYWPAYGGGDLSSDGYKASAMHFFKNLADGLNYSEYLIDGYEPSYYDKNIFSIGFYHNLIIIEKGDNTESSNVQVTDQPRIEKLRHGTAEDGIV
jgi:demethylmacrocin O-methyltransferase